MRGGIDQALNPGHLIGHDEWVHTPVRPGSTEKLRSGMPFQVDVIPVPMKDNWALNHEDSVTFADDALRAASSERSIPPSMPASKPGAPSSDERSASN